ncbi:hypothetical protein CC78DRAFT_207102 [Lojkania enalia]|uniref:Uncharacterized protein n=1 Tax=Lojkania enalia TaxID=147567 RepID=A0A9P4KEU5_9PLEO|nr:hypothetical protein CC78DRAFT_207102 [Didymosphaeria enalia]
MHFTKSCAILALATGFAAATPVRSPESLPEYRRSPGFSPNPAKRGDISVFGNGFGGDKFDIFNKFNDFNDQNLFLNFKQVDQTFVNNGFGDEIFIQKAKEVLIIDQQNNGFNNKFNNLARKSFFRNNFPGQTTIFITVKTIKVAIIDDFGVNIEKDIFAQNVQIANRGFGATKVVMIKEQQTIIAQDVFNQFGNFNDFNGFNGFVPGVGAVSGFPAVPTATQDFQLFGQEPTWSEIVADPAATVAPAWQAELEDLNNVDNQNENNAEQEKLLEEEKAQLEALEAEQQKNATVVEKH